MTIKRYNFDDVQKFKDKYKHLKIKRGDDYAKRTVVDTFRDKSRIALFAYVAFPHYFNRLFKDVHYEHLEHVEIGTRHKRNKATMAYRGEGKTSIELVLQNVYEACYNTFQYVVINSYNSNMSTDKLRLIKEEFEMNEFIRYFYGNPIREKEYWNKQDLTVYGRTRFTTVSTGENPRGLLARGDRPQKIVSDDILSDVDVRSADLRAQALDWYKKALAECLATDGVLEILNTPLHPEDVIMQIFKGDPPFHANWDTLKLPAMKNGKTVDKDWKTTKELKEKAKDEYTFQQELMCNPLKINSGMVKFDDLRAYETLPKIIQASMHADTTHTGKTTSDYFACGIIGEGEDGNFYLIDMVIEQCEVNEQAEHVINLYKRYARTGFELEDDNSKFDIVKLSYDEKANQGFGYWVKKMAVQDHALSLPIEEMKYPNDKVTHFKPHVPHFKANRVYIPQTHKYLKIFLDQLLAFPQKGVHDDAVDLVSGCLDLFHGPTPAVH